MMMEFLEKEINFLASFYRQRDLRKNVYSLSPSGEPNYGNPDLVFNNNKNNHLVVTLLFWDGHMMEIPFYTLTVLPAETLER